MIGVKHGARLPPDSLPRAFLAGTMAYHGLTRPVYFCVYERMKALVSRLESPKSTEYTVPKNEEGKKKKKGKEQMTQELGARAENVARYGQRTGLAPMLPHPQEP